MTYSMHHVTVSLTYACVAESPDDAQRIARAEVENDLSSAPLAVSVTSALATEMIGHESRAAEQPLWEFMDIHEMPDDAEERRDPDFVVPSEHHTRRWTIRRWLAEQARDAMPAVAQPTEAAADGWGGPPTPAELRAHHESHSVGDSSWWHMRVGAAPRAHVVEIRHAAMQWLPSEITRWRPCAADLSPVARTGGDP